MLSQHHPIASFPSLRARLLLVACMALAPPLTAQVTETQRLVGRAQQVDFVRDVRPIFEKRCSSCHGEKKQKFGLRLDIRSEALKGGSQYAPNIVPGKAKESPLLRFVTGEDEDLVMPPRGERLPADEVATLRAWIDEGAVWPVGVHSASLADKRDHWSFRAVQRVDAPVSKTHGWPREIVDHFVFARLEQEGLRPAPEADRVTWLRRVSLDLVGLPPAPEHVHAFLKDERRDAYERVVDDLLRSPRYGERWAQHWLDVVRYADTHGFEVNTERPTAWPYRDYVIGALNNDVPYDRFIRDQIVGSDSGGDAATGFLVTASVLLPGQIGRDAPSMRLARQDSLDEIVVNIGQSFLGLSMGCARCHDHKFDPISQRDYYSMQAFVAGVEYGERELRTPEAEAAREEARRLREQLDGVHQELASFVPLAGSGAERVSVNARMNWDRFAPVKAKRVRFTITATNSLEPCLDELEVFDAAGSNVALARRGTKATSSGETVFAGRHDLRYVNDGRFGNSSSWMSDEKGKGWVELEFAEERLVGRVVWGRDRAGKYGDRLAVDYSIEVPNASGEWRTVADSSDRAKYGHGEKPPAAPFTTGLCEGEAKAAARLVENQKALEARIAKAETRQKAFVGRFCEPDAIHILRRGDPEQPEEEVGPAVPSALGNVSLAKDSDEKDRRLALADWLASEQNPLTARVMVNRIWQGHFGTGLVETPNDFGHNGSRPSHPALLDWLASEFVRSGWSMKHMHRLIVLSATYRQSSRHDPVAAAKDAGVRLLWRFPSRRLEGEAIRDSMLAVNGRLNLKAGGPGFDLFDKRGGLSGFQPVESFSDAGLRRMIYAHRVRRERDAVFGAFDCPDGGQSTPRRGESTTPIQALGLFNSRFTIDQAKSFADRVKKEVGDDTSEQVRRAWQLALSRDPSALELGDAEGLVHEHGLLSLCRVLFNSNEFVFLR